MTNTTHAADRGKHAARPSPRGDDRAASAGTTERPGTMRAVLQPTFGGPEAWRVGDAPRPTAGRDQVLVRVRAAGLSVGDLHVLTGKPYLMRAMGFGLRRPSWPVAGQAFAGVVEEVGAEVTGLAPGDRVFGEVQGGAFAEYVVATPEQVVPLPANLTFEEGASVPSAALTALQGLRDVGRVTPGQRVLVVGAAGSVGSWAVQVARDLGAHVTAVCGAASAARVRGLGAEVVVDYAREDFVARDDRFDVVFDLVGDRSLGELERVLTERGTLVSCTGQRGGDWFGPILWLAGTALANRFSKRRLVTFVTEPRRADLEHVAARLAAGALVPTVDRTYPLEEAVPAMRHVAERHAKGRTILRFD